MRTTTVVIGAGHSGLAMSRRLAERSIDHVVLERGEVANSWRTERWESLRLLTPNWQSRLPGGGYAGDDPDGHLSALEVAELLGDYATAIDAPVRTGTAVERVSRVDEGYRVATSCGEWIAQSVVLASGGANQANVPALAEGIPASVAQVTPLDYRSPDALPPGGVLIVGASATGAQFADELARAGRRVVLSVGEHVRLPRDYRGRDIFWWMDAAGVLDERHDQVDDLIRARHTPSPQLVGTPERRVVDLAALVAQGVELVGRLGTVRDGVALFSGGLANTVRLADLKSDRLLERFDAWAAEAAPAGLDAPHRLAPTVVDEHPRLQLDLEAEGIAAVIWATGFRPDFSWLDLPVFGYKGAIRHDGGVLADAPGAYLLGHGLLRRRRSTYISGAADDTRELADHLVRRLARRQRGG